MYKIIFLDIDGVLNSSLWRKSKTYSTDKSLDGNLADIDPDTVDRLNQITDNTGACIVVSSTWRWGWAQDFLGMLAFFRKVGVTGKVIDITPINDDGRHQQIQQWLDMTDDVDAFVILDDIDWFAGILHKYLVLTDPRVGLQNADVQSAIQILNK